MKDVFSALAALRRPRLLIRAARIGALEYRRAVHLRRHLGCDALPGSGAAVVQLMEIEAEIEERRRTAAAGYSAARHIDVLIALMGEARLMQATRPVAAVR
ncbi:DUF6477 family protein [Roseovarius salinarum]|uniref:DUF6477 family protein n=1 Tax=Roseovarius salinarum TaxID=1981892 RepID=UPI000C33878B|nr:DUF6477 family protein [Roseovarius salinarum]